MTTAPLFLMIPANGNDHELKLPLAYEQYGEEWHHTISCAQLTAEKIVALKPIRAVDNLSRTIELKLAKNLGAGSQRKLYFLTEQNSTWEAVALIAATTATATLAILWLTQSIALTALSLFAVSIVYSHIQYPL